MRTLVTVHRPSDWPINVPGVEVVAARTYLTDDAYSRLRGARVFNLCRSYRYQAVGYYVSLLAAARGQRPIPSATTILDMKSTAVVRIVSEDQDDLIQRSLSSIRSDRFVLSIYFGRNLAKRYDRLCARLYNLFPAPLLRANFLRDSKWHLQSITPIAATEIPESHRPFVIEEAQRYFGRRATPKKQVVSRYDLAILWNPTDPTSPSNAGAIKKFAKAAAALGIRAEIIDKDDYGQLAEFDALFLRETTAVNHHTYRFARRAQALGMVVIDDPESILQCTNKVFLAELLHRHHLRTPETRVLHRDNVDAVLEEIGLPAVLKKPDSSFSLGVTRASTAEEFRAQAARLLEESDLVIVQRFLKSDFDWRVGVLDRQPLYVCKYHMAPHHWQIVRRGAGRELSGRVDTIAVADAPARVVRTALRAANLIGDGLYGVDLKQAGNRVHVIEINDNPSIEAGNEDRVLKQDLYLRIMESFARRLDRMTAAPRSANRR